MARAFYWELAPSGLGAATDATAALLLGGVMPAGGLDLEHYREAVAWHRRGRIRDAELAAVALIARLSLTARATTGRKVLQRVGAPEVASTLLHLGFPGRPPLPPLLALLARHRLRGIKGMARLALLGWHCGLYPGVLAMGEVSAGELLTAQAAGRRHVGVGLPEAGFAATDGDYPGGFTHHDLCHLAKFRGSLADPTVYAGQVGFFAAFAAAVAAEPELLAPRPDLPPGMDLTVVATDTNGDVRLLVTLLLARLLARRAHGGVPLDADGRVAMVGHYLNRFGMAADLAATAARIYDTARAEFLAQVGQWFEAYGRRRLG